MSMELLMNKSEKDNVIDFELSRLERYYVYLLLIGLFITVIGMVA